MLGISMAKSNRLLAAALKAGAARAPARAALKMVTMGITADRVSPAVSGSCLENRENNFDDETCHSIIELYLSTSA